MLLPRQFSSREKGAQGAEKSSVLCGSSRVKVGAKGRDAKCKAPLVGILSGLTDAA
jgi:hypothetical protein